MRQIDTSPLAGTATTSVLLNSSRLGFLVLQFRRALERQRRADAEWIATFERVARDPRVRRVIKQICEKKELSRHG